MADHELSEGALQAGLVQFVGTLDQLEQRLGEGEGVAAVDGQ